MTEPTDQPYQHPENYAAIGYPTVRTLNRAQKLSIAELLQHVLPYRPPSGSVLMIDSEGSPLSFFDPTGLDAASRATRTARSTRPGSTCPGSPGTSTSTTTGPCSCSGWWT